MAQTEIKVVRGDTFEGTANLREIDSCDTSKENTFEIPAGSTIEMLFPGETASVSLTTGASEVTIESYAKGEVSFVMPPAKTDLLKVGSKQTIVLQVNYNAGADRKTFQRKKFLTVADADVL